MILRQARFEEIDELLELWQEAGLDSLRPHGRDSMEAFERQIETGVQRVFVAELDDRIIGAVIATHDGRKGWVNRLAVRPLVRRSGVAWNLLDMAEEWLDQCGIEVIACLIEKENRSSVQLFHRAGYDLDRGVLYMSKRKRADS